MDLHTILRVLIRARTVSSLATALSRGLAASRSVALARVWLTSAEGLALAGSAGTPSGGGSYVRVDKDFREMAVADTTMAAVAQSRRPLIVRGIRGDEEWLINPSWAARQGVRAFVGLPMISEEHVTGVLAVFDREIPGEDLLAQLQLLADIAAARLTDLSSLTSVAAGDLRPSQEPPSAPTGTEVPSGDGGHRGGRRSVITRAELRRVEKENIEVALERTGGKVFGADGAAALLGMKPTTLASRIKALGIR